MAATLAVGLLLGCSDRGSSHPGGAYQGVIEFDDRVLAFEVPGKLSGVGASQGETVAPGKQLASLDSELQAALLEVRKREMDRARAQVSVVGAGPRSEEVRAARARLKAARKSERLVRAERGRVRELVISGSAAESQLDKIDGELGRVAAEREVLAQGLRGLQKGARKEQLLAAEAGQETAKAVVELERKRLGHQIR